MPKIIPILEPIYTRAIRKLEKFLKENPKYDSPDEALEGDDQDKKFEVFYEEARKVTNALSLARIHQMVVEEKRLLNTNSGGTPADTPARAVIDGIHSELDGYYDSWHKTRYPKLKTTEKKPTSKISVPPSIRKPTSKISVPPSERRGR